MPYIVYNGQYVLSGGSFVGSIASAGVTFTKLDNEGIGVYDAISPNMWIGRGDTGGGLFNVKEFPTYQIYSDPGPQPVGTLWNSQYTDVSKNGWTDTSDIRDRGFGTLYQACDKSIGNNVVGEEFIMHLTEEDEFHKVKFSSWSSGGAGGGFSYEREEITDAAPKTDFIFGNSLGGFDPSILFSMPADSSITVDWGDGTAPEVFGPGGSPGNVSMKHTYTNNNTYYPIKMSGDLDLVDEIIGWNVTGSMYEWGDYLTGLTDITSNGYTRGRLHGDISYFASSIPNLSYANFRYSGVAGDLAGWETLTDMTYLDLGWGMITADLSTFSTMTNLTYLGLSSTYAKGNLSEISNLTNLESLDMRTYSSYPMEIIGTPNDVSSLTSLKYLNALWQRNFSGDIEPLSELSNLSYLQIQNTQVTGDMSQLGNISTIEYVYAQETSIGFETTNTWTSDSSVLHYWDCNLTSTDVDNALIGLAAGPMSNGTIWLGGNNAARTSASASAMSTLAGRGNTIWVNL